jgi:glycosyltransferase involved in cell wall biosynthesis
LPLGRGKPTELKGFARLTFVVWNRPSSGRKALLFVPGAAPEASFVSADRDALAARVRVVEVPPRSGLGHVAFAAALGRALARERPARAVVWFAAATYGAATLAACRLAGVPCLVVAGGMDVAACPEIGFGEARGGWRRAASRWALEAAALVWAFSESARREILQRASPKAMAVVPPAVDTAYFRAPDGQPRERLVVSTCAAISPLTIVQKGLDRLVAAAGRAPDIQVVVTGRADASAAPVRAFVSGAPANVTFAGHVSREALRALYARAAVVAQFSRHEGFGVAAAEGLAMHCAVVTSALPAFDEVVGGPGHHRVADDAAPEAVAAILRAAIEAPPATSRWAEVDRRYGGAVRAAAWDHWLAREGLVAPPR